MTALTFSLLHKKFTWTDFGRVYIHRYPSSLRPWNLRNYNPFGLQNLKLKLKVKLEFQLVS